MTVHLEPEIVFSHLLPSEALEAAIRRKVSHLTQFCQDLHACRVVVEPVQRHARQGRPFEVRVEVRLNRQELVANRSRHEDVYVALRDAFDDMRRQLEDAVRRRRATADRRDSVRRWTHGFNEASPVVASGTADAGTGSSSSG